MMYIDVHGWRDCLVCNMLNFNQGTMRLSHSSTALLGS